MHLLIDVLVHVVVVPVIIFHLLNLGLFIESWVPFCFFQDPTICGLGTTFMRVRKVSPFPV